MPLQLEPAKTRPPCKMARIINDADPDDAQTIRSWLDDPSLQHARLSRSLKASGMDISENAVGTHRRGECACVQN